MGIDLKSYGYDPAPNLTAGLPEIAAGAASPLGWVSTGLGLLKGVGGLFGSNKTQTNQSAAYSGLGPFQSDNNFDFSYRKTIDLKDPVEVAVLAGLIVLGVYAWKKVKA